MQVASGRIPPRVVWMTILTVDLSLFSNAFAVSKLGHNIGLRIFLEHLWGVYEENIGLLYMVYILGLMIMLIWNGAKFHNVSYGQITETSIGMFLYGNVIGRKGRESQIQLKTKFPKPTNVGQRTSDIILDHLIFCVWDLMTLQSVIGNGVSPSEFRRCGFWVGIPQYIFRNGSVY